MILGRRGSFGKAIVNFSAAEVTPFQFRLSSSAWIRICAILYWLSESGSKGETYSICTLASSGSKGGSSTEASARANRAVLLLGWSGFCIIKSSRAYRPSVFFCSQSKSAFSNLSVTRMD